MFSKKSLFDGVQQILVFCNDNLWLLHPTTYLKAKEQQESRIWYSGCIQEFNYFAMLLQVLPFFLHVELVFWWAIGKIKLSNKILVELLAMLLVILVCFGLKYRIINVADLWSIICKDPFKMLRLGDP